MNNVLKAERIKLTTVQSPKWCTAIVVFLGLGIAALVSSTSAPSSISFAVSGVSGLGMFVLMILATLSITSEYRFGIIRSTFQAVPDRTQVLVGKALLLSGFGALLTGVVAVLALGVAKLMSDGAADKLALASGADWRALYGIPIYAAVSVVFAVGLGALVRQAAAAISILILWPLLVETLLARLPGIGEDLGPFLPFANGSYFLAEADSDVYHWGHWGGLLYFAAFAFAIFGAAVVLMNKRDA